MAVVAQAATFTTQESPKLDTSVTVFSCTKRLASSPENSPAFQRWDFYDKKGASPVRDERTVLIEHSLVVLQTMLVQHRPKLFAKRPFSVMFRLVANVSHRRFNSRNADAE